MRTVPSATQLPTDTGVRRSSWPLRLRARLRAGRLDRHLDAGGPMATGTVLAIHAERIVSVSERHRLACGLQTALDRAHAGANPVRLSLRRRQILADEPLIRQIMERLGAAQPVRPRGIARLRMLLSDGAGPLYTTGSGSLPAQLRGVIAAL